MAKKPKTTPRRCTHIRREDFNVEEPDGDPRDSEVAITEEITVGDVRDIVQNTFEGPRLRGNVDIELTPLDASALVSENREAFSERFRNGGIASIGELIGELVTKECTDGTGSPAVKVIVRLLDEYDGGATFTCFCGNVVPNRLTRIVGVDEMCIDCHRTCLAEVG